MTRNITQLSVLDRLTHERNLPRLIAHHTACYHVAGGETDQELATDVMGLPSRYKVRGLDKKWILRRAMRGVLPDVILDAPKHGFGVPFEAWLRTPLAPYLRSVLLDGSVKDAGLFEPSIVERIVAEHTGDLRDHGFLLWKALHLQLWIRQYRIDSLRTT